MAADDGRLPIEFVECDGSHLGELIGPDQLEKVPDEVAGRLGVSDIVEQLRDLIRVVGPEVAIGLFGSSGVGKTTLGKLLRKERLTGRDTNSKENLELTSVYFDASRCAGPALRRNLIEECAVELGENRDKINRLLRGERKFTRHFLRHPREFILLFVALCFLVSLIGLVLALGPVLTAGGNPEETVKRAFGATLAPAVLAAIALSIHRSVTTEWSLPAPEEDDDLLKVFDDLLKRHKRKRLLVFVDEIDHCPPDEVADALRGVRTFFGKPRCVFVVAADREALARALTFRLERSTVFDTADPYYGAASLYLDRLFPYQLTVPPLRTDALYQFARDLTRKRPGIWKQLNENEESARLLVSVLIPPHITSPRQVKALLNSFVVTHRLLVRRGVVGQDTEEDRLREVAKLVCLRCEFPLFAADLHVDPDLPDLVLRATRGTLGEIEVAPYRAERAQAYAEGRLPVAALPRENADDGEVEGSEFERELRRQDNRELVRYLDETEKIDGPGRDLVHAQGFNSGLPNRDAVALTRAALDSDPVKLHTALEEIREHAREAAEQKAGGVTEDAVHQAEREALHLLSRRVRAKQDEQTRNAMRSLLEAVDVCESALDEVTARSIASRVRLSLRYAAAEQRTGLKLLAEKSGDRHVEERARDLGIKPTPPVGAEAQAPGGGRWTTVHVGRALQVGLVWSAVDRNSVGRTPRA